MILSDGYMYYKNNCTKDGNRYSYILQSSEHMRIFRNNPNSVIIFNREDYGFINAGNSLNDLFILALEFAPYQELAADFDIQKLYWEKWFEEQGMKRERYKIVKSDLSSLNKPVIKNFIIKAGE